MSITGNFWDYALVYGIARKYESEIKINIPDEIKFLILQYHHIEEHFELHGDYIQINQNCTIISNNTPAVHNTAYGSIIIQPWLQNWYHWSFKVMKIDDVYPVSIGIDEACHPTVNFDFTMKAGSGVKNYAYAISSHGTIAKPTHFATMNHLRFITAEKYRYQSGDIISISVHCQRSQQFRNMSLSWCEFIVEFRIDGELVETVKQLMQIHTPNDHWDTYDPVEALKKDGTCCGFRMAVCLPGKTSVKLLQYRESGYNQYLTRRNIALQWNDTREYRLRDIHSEKVFH